MAGLTWAQGSQIPDAVVGVIVTAQFGNLSATFCGQMTEEFVANIGKSTSDVFVFNLYNIKSLTAFLNA